MSYETMRDINGWLNLICAAIVMLMGLWLIWRGGHERPWWKPIPGRLVIGAAIIVYALARLEEGFWRVLSGTGPGQVGRHVNDWNTIFLLSLSTLLFLWSFVRFLRNDLEVHEPASWGQDPSKNRDPTLLS